MSDNPRLRWGFSNEQTPRNATCYAKSRFKRRQSVQRITEPLSNITVASIAHHDNLIRTYYAQKAKAGQAPGPDHFTYKDWSTRDVADIMRTLSRAVLDGTYLPGPVRSVRIPKLNGGYRTLRLSNLCERVLAAALHRALEPLWERTFLPWSMGFRPGRSVWRLLAELEATILKEDCWVLAIDDIKQGFRQRRDRRRHLRPPAFPPGQPTALPYQGGASGQRWTE